MQISPSSLPGEVSADFGPGEYAPSLSPLLACCGGRGLADATCSANGECPQTPPWTDCGGAHPCKRPYFPDELRPRSFSKLSIGTPTDRSTPSSGLGRPVCSFAVWPSFPCPTGHFPSVYPPEEVGFRPNCTCPTGKFPSFWAPEQAVFPIPLQQQALWPRTGCFRPNFSINDRPFPRDEPWSAPKWAVLGPV